MMIDSAITVGAGVLQKSCSENFYKIHGKAPRLVKRDLNTGGFWLTGFWLMFQCSLL